MLAQSFFRQTWKKNCASTIFLSSDVAKIFLFSLWNLRFLKKVHHFSDKTFFKPTKKPEKWKKHSVLIFVLATTFVKICPCLIWEFPKLPRKHFSASAYGLGFKKLFLGSLFSTSVTWEKVKSDVDKFCLRRVKNKYRNKILFFSFPQWVSLLKQKLILNPLGFSLRTSVDHVELIFKERNCVKDLIMKFGR